jgi:aldehyde:ferredoxin oxidoreductase
MQEHAVGGYHGRILRVDLSRGTVAIEKIDPRFCRKYIGGAGFVAYYLHKEIKNRIDPLGPENKIIFATGPLTGIALPGSGRHCVGGVSPLTGTISKSEVGEFWGAELKQAGFDAVIVDGKSSHPVYLWVNNGQASLRDATNLWGKPTKETQEAIRQELGDNKIRVAMIGPAGENEVKYACVMHGLKDAAGRGGLGAVMGSKKLKAVAVRGTQSLTVSQPDDVKTLRKWLVDNMEKFSRMREFGTGAKMEDFEKTGNLPIRNFKGGQFPGVVKIDAQAIKDSIGVGMEGCFACPVRCKKVIRIESPDPVDSAYGGPEYETLAALGSNCGIDDLAMLSKISALCNAYSIDTISVGGTIAFAMECYENGLLTEEDTGGKAIQFGDGAAAIDLVERIARREGLGDLLAEGSARAAENIGNGAEAFSMHVKKLELPMHEPRLNRAGALGYMINPHGADHCTNLIDHAYRSSVDNQSLAVGDAAPLGYASISFDDIGPRKVALLKVVQLKRILFDSLTLCQFLPYSYEQIAEVTSAVTGWHTTVMEQLRVAERILTLFRAFNVRQGLTDEDDKLPARFFAPPGEGPLSDQPPLEAGQMEKAKKYYYSLMGWDAHGVPTDEKMEELGIERQGTA